MPVPSLDVVIVNWNAGAHLRTCLDSLSTAQTPVFSLARVIIVDNNSSDDSLDGVDVLRGGGTSGPRGMPLPLQVIRNGSNRGFAAACNQGAAAGSADFILFLNPDVRLRPDTLEKVVSVMDLPIHSRTGIIGVQLLDEDGALQRTCARFPTAGRFVARALGLDRLAPAIFPNHFMTDWDHAESRFVDQVMGAFMLTRRTLFTSVEGFDERFFVYFEEVDYARRLFELGWRTYYLAEAQAYHIGAGTTEQVKPLRLYYSLASRLIYGFKHFGRAGGSFQLAGTLVIEPIARLINALRLRSSSAAVETIHGYALLYRNLHDVLRGEVRAV